MTYLIKQGLPPGDSFKIMECVRKGKGLTEEQEALMREYNVPEWYIDSCKKIKYMFPKAHAVAYVTMAFRIAWFKVNYPLAYYCAYYTIRADDFDSEIMIYGKEKVKQKMKELETLGNSMSVKEKGVYTILEIVQEMYERGFKFLPIDLYKSHSTKFQIEDGKIRPPLSSIPGLRRSSSRGYISSSARRKRKIHVNRRLSNKIKSRKSNNRNANKIWMLRRNEQKQSN